MENNISSYQIIEENLYLDIDFEKEVIQGKSDFLIRVSSINSKNLFLELTALQIFIHKISVLETKHLILHDYKYSSPDKQAKFLSELFPEPLSFDVYVSNFQRIESLKHKPIDRILINLLFDTEKPINFEPFTFRLEIVYELVKPISGLIFLKYFRNSNNPAENYLYSTNFHRSSRLWKPCFWENNSEDIHVSLFTIIVPSGYLPICSGAIQEILEQEDKKKKAYVYQINKKISFEKIGLCVGNFTFLNKDSDFYIFGSKSFAKESFKETMKIYEEMIIFAENYNKSTYFANSFYKFVYLPHIASHFSENMQPLSFSNMCFCDEEYMIDPNEREIYLRNKREIFQTITWSMVNEIRVQSELQDKWILFGFNSFLADQFRATNENEQKIYIAELFALFNKFVKEGKEIFPISCENNTRNFADHESDEIIRLKSRLIFHMITSLANCKKQIAKILFSKQFINTEYFLKTIKINFGIKKIKYFVKQFIKSTGIPEIEVSYRYARKEKKIYLSFSQSPSQEKYFEMRQKFRVELEEKKFGKPSQELAFLEKEKKLAVPEICKSWRYFYGKLHVIVCETNEIDYKEESHQIFLDKKPESKAMINCRAQFRKTINKRINDNEDELGAGTSIMDYGHNAAASSLYESKKKMSIFTFNNSARNPMLWIKIDPENEFFHDIHIIYDSEAVLLMQLAKEKDAGAIYNLLKTLRNYCNLTTVNTLCSLLETKDCDINIKLLMIRCLLDLSSENTGWRSLDLLTNILKKNCLESDGSLKPNNFAKYDEYLINKAIIHGISQLKDEKNEEQHLTNPNTVNFLLKLLQENDNQRNEFTDSFYKSELIRAILQSNHPKCVFDILFEIYRSLEEEITNHSCKYVVLKTVLKFFGKFLENNKLSENFSKKNCHSIKSNQIIIEKIYQIKNKIKILKKFAMVEYFMFKLAFFEKFRNFHSWELIIYALKKLENFRTSKSFILSKFEGMLLEFVKYIEKSGNNYISELQSILNLYNNSRVASLLWEQMTSGFSFISPKIRVIFFKKIIKLYINFMFLIQFLWLRLYRVFYFHFIPLSNKMINTDNNNNINNEFFCLYALNPLWLENVQTKKNEDQTKNKNILNLNYLSINKRKRVTLEKSKLNPKDTLISCLTKSSSDNEITWKSLAKCILTILMSEKLTDNIEKKFLNEEIDNTQINENAEFNFVIKIKSPLTLKLIKKKLNKGMYDDLDQIQTEVYEVIENYKKNDLIQGEIAKEYLLLIDMLFQESKKILTEVQENNFNLDHYNQNKIKLPKIKLTFDGKETKFSSISRVESKNLMN